MGSGRGSAEIEGWSPTHSAEMRRMDGAHGLESGAHGTLATLVRRIFAETELARLRLSSIEPMDWDAELIGLVAEFGGTRLARHAHLPLQSGSDAGAAADVSAVPAVALRGQGCRAAGGGGAGADAGRGCDGGVSGRDGCGVCGDARAGAGVAVWVSASVSVFSAAGAQHCMQQPPIAAEAMRERMAALRALAAEKMRAHRERMVGRELDAITLHTPGSAGGRGQDSGADGEFFAGGAGETVRVQSTCAGAGDGAHGPKVRWRRWPQKTVTRGCAIHRIVARLWQSRVVLRSSWHKQQKQPQVFRLRLA